MDKTSLGLFSEQVEGNVAPVHLFEKIVLPLLVCQ